MRKSFSLMDMILSIILLVQDRWGKLSYTSHPYYITVINSQQLSEMKFFIAGTSTYLFPGSTGKFNELTNMKRMAFFKIAICPNKVSMTHIFYSSNLNLSTCKMSGCFARATWLFFFFYLTCTQHNYSEIHVYCCLYW